VEVLIARLTSPSRDVRLRVVEALGNIGSAKAVPGLMRALKDADPEVRRAAAEALGDIKEGQ
jgi:HEAT repeat protein